MRVFEVQARSMPRDEPRSRGRLRALLVLAGLALSGTVSAEPAPAYVATWYLNNPNEYPSVISSVAGRVLVGVQLFSTQGYVVEYDTGGAGVRGFDWTMTPVGVAGDGHGSVYASFARCNCVRKLDDPVAVWGDTGSAPGEFNRIAGIAIDAEGFLYAADRGNHRVQKLLLDGTPITTWGDFGTGPGQLSNPDAVAVDNAGHVYVTDSVNDKVLKYTTAGAFVTEWGDSGSALGQFRMPGGIAADGHGRVYVTDAHQRIQKFTDQGVPLAAWGVPDSTNGWPIDVAADGQGGVYVVDPYVGVFKFQETSLASVPAPRHRALAIEAIAPNPFRDRLSIRWAQRDAGAVQITLADVSGRRIASLASGTRSAGRHELSISASLPGGARLAPGIYWVRVRAGGREEARRVVFMR